MILYLRHSNIYLTEYLREKNKILKDSIDRINKNIDELIFILNFFPKKIYKIRNNCLISKDNSYITNIYMLLKELLDLINLFKIKITNTEKINYSDTFDHNMVCYINSIEECIKTINNSYIANININIIHILMQMPVHKIDDIKKQIHNLHKYIV